MKIHPKKNSVLLGILILFCVQPVFAGPPFDTDDPQPVDFKHWEYYISSINTFQSHTWSGTSPHFEVNYGLIPNIQIHLLMPINYNYSRDQGGHLGYASTEFGIKYRFIKETDNRPQVGTFPIVEIPTIRNNEFSNGKAQDINLGFPVAKFIIPNCGYFDNWKGPYLGSVIGFFDKAVLNSKFGTGTVSYTHLRAHETRHDLVCRLL